MLQHGKVQQSTVQQSTIWHSTAEHGNGNEKVENCGKKPAWKPSVTDSVATARARLTGSGRGSGILGDATIIDIQLF